MTTQSALARYEELTSLGTYVGWQALADDLRTEAETMTGGMRTKRIDRALLCESRALAQRTVAAFRAGERR